MRRFKGFLVSEEIFNREMCHYGECSNFATHYVFLLRHHALGTYCLTHSELWRDWKETTQILSRIRFDRKAVTISR